MPDVLVPTWTGRHADALRQALRMTNESFAEYLGVAPRTVAYWRSKPAVQPVPSMQQILDTALARAPESARAQFQAILGGRTAASTLAADGDAADLTAWLTMTGTSDETIDGLARTAAALAEAHSRREPAGLLGDARQLQARVQQLLRDGRLRHRQERELLRVSGDLLAHVGLLLGDLDRPRQADEYGQAALLYLREAGGSEATAWYVLAKNARWSHRYHHAADLAAQGLASGAAGSMRTQLASYEANAAALAGDAGRARTAMRRAEEAAATGPGSDGSTSPWAFPEERMAIFRLSVALHTGDPETALRTAATAPDTWSHGPHVPAAWAQIRIGGAIACLLNDEPDGSAEHVAPVLAMPAALRIATVTGWLADLDSHLAAERYARMPAAVDLRGQIRDFTISALRDRDAKEDPQ